MSARWAHDNPSSGSLGWTPRPERSRGWIVRQALSAWIEREEERNRLTREALDDVGAGRVIDHQAVQAWADRLSTDNPLPVLR